MATATQTNPVQLEDYCRDVAERARDASQQLVTVSTAKKNAWLARSAAMLRSETQKILTANEADLAAAPAYGLTPAEIDRLKLTPDRVNAIAKGLEEIAQLPDPVGEIVEGTRRPNGLEIQKMRVPLGVVFFIVRVATKCDSRRSSDLHQERQRSDFAWWKRGCSLQPCDRRAFAIRPGGMWLT